MIFVRNLQVSIHIMLTYPLHPGTSKQSNRRKRKAFLIMDGKGHPYSGLTLRSWSKEVVYQKPAAHLQAPSKVWAIC